MRHNCGFFALVCARARVIRFCGSKIGARTRIVGGRLMFSADQWSRRVRGRVMRRVLSRMLSMALPFALAIFTSTPAIAQSDAERATNNAAQSAIQSQIRSSGI
jgi:hypothetical protein